MLRIALALSLLLFAPAWATPTFPALTGRVVDAAQVLSPQAEQRLTDELAALEQKTGRQLVVATLPSLQGYEIEDYGYQLGRAWKIGDEQKDDGALLIVAPNERKVRIEVGYGLEPVLTDALSSLILQRKILPAFKAGDIEKGVVEGTEAIAAQLGLPPEEAQARAAEAQREARAAARPDDGGSIWPLIAGVFVVIWLLSGALRVFGGRRRFGGSGLWWLLPLILSNSSRGGGRGWSGGGGGGGGGFSGGGGSFGGGGSSGSW